MVPGDGFSRAIRVVLAHSRYSIFGSGEDPFPPSCAAHVDGVLGAQHVRCSGGGPDPHRVVGAGAGASRCPSGLNTHTEHRVGVAAQGAEGWPVSAFHSRTVPSAPAVPVGAQRRTHLTEVAGQLITDPRRASRSSRPSRVQPPRPRDHDALQVRAAQDRRPAHWARRTDASSSR